MRGRARELARLAARVAELVQGLSDAADKASMRVSDMPDANPLTVLREVEYDLEQLVKGKPKGPIGADEEESE